MKVIYLLPALLSPILMGAGGGCEPDNATNQQIELNIPASVRTCVRAKDIHNPGRGAGDKAKAVYTTKLYYALEDCGANMDSVNRLYTAWKARVAKVNK